MRMTFWKTMVAVAALFTLGACAASDPQDGELPDMGNFQLKWTIVVSENAEVVPPSRTATPEEWKQTLTSEVDRRFRGYAGGEDFHIALNIDGYALAPPGIPVILAPKSILVLSANVWNHDQARKLHEEPKRIVVFEGASAATVIGSGFSKSKEEQMRLLSRNAAKEVQDWMLTNPEWFGLPPLRSNTAARVE